MTLEVNDRSDPCIQGPPTTTGGDQSDLGRSDIAADFLQSLPTSDVVVWTDCSVPSSLGAGGAGIRAVSVAHPLPHCPTQLALSPLASRLNPLHWCMAWNGVTPV